MLAAPEWHNRKVFDLSSGHHEFNKGAVFFILILYHKFHGSPPKTIEMLMSQTVAAHVLPRLCRHILLHLTATVL